MKAEDVTATLEQALVGSGLDSANVKHGPRLLCDNGSSYIANDLAAWMDDRQMKHVRGAPYHPMTQAKIERWHQTLKNRLLLEHCNHRRSHESLSNLTSAHVYLGRGETLLRRCQAIKRKPWEQRRLQHSKTAA